jgi:hypothetical protein
VESGLGSQVAEARCDDESVGANRAPMTSTATVEANRIVGATQLASGRLPASIDRRMGEP